MAKKKTTISVIKADIGGYVGHSAMHPEIVKTAQDTLKKAKKDQVILDYRVMNCGDDLELIMTHTKGEENRGIHKLAWDIFMKCTRAAKRIGLYGAGQDMLADSFSGNVKGQGPGVAEMEFVERPSEPVIIFMADKTSPGAWNRALFKIFADPFNTAGLVIDPKLVGGFQFEVLDVEDNKKVLMSTPEEMYSLLALIGAHSRYMIPAVYRKSDGEIGAKGSVQRLSRMAGRYVGKDDPVLIVRCQSGFPAVGEVLEPFSDPYLVEGWMRGSHNGPLMPVAFEDATPTRFDGPPRVIAAGFQVHGGKLVGPRDMFKDKSYDHTREMANLIADYMRRGGPFEPSRLGLEGMEYTTLPQVLESLKDRFK